MAAVEGVNDQKAKNNVKWNKLLSEDLEELLKQRVAELEQFRKKQTHNIGASQSTETSSDQIKKKQSVLSPEKSKNHTTTNEDDIDTEEKKKRQAFLEEQELRAFHERGGFHGVLKDLFRPAANGIADLDSVH